MDFVFGLREPNNALKAIGFYVIHFIIVLGLGALSGVLFASTYAGGGVAGMIVAIVYSTLVCIMVVYQRKLPPGYYGFLALVIPCAILLGGLLGLVVPAVLTTRGT